MSRKKLLILLLFTAVTLNAEKLERAVNLTTEANEHSLKVQEKINDLVEKKDELYSQFKTLSNELKSLNQYNNELKDIVNSQENEKNSIIKQIDKIDDTKRDILPLIKNMLLSLEEFVNNDTPFLYKERTKRVKRLKKLVKRSDVSVSTKYAAVIEAFEIENEYSRTIETYNDILDSTNSAKNVKFLRLGRVGFYYLTEDNKECALWDNETKSWIKLDNTHTYKLNEAIKIAAKKTVPNLLNLPLFTPKAI